MQQQQSDQEQTFLIPLSVNAGFEFFGMNGPRLRLVLVAAVVAAIIWATTGGQPVKVQYGLPFAIVALAYVLCGCPLAEDDRTLYEQWRLQRAYSRQQKVYFYRKTQKEQSP